MKLNLLFVAMDLITLLAYPIVLGQGLLRRLFRSKADRALANLRITDPAAEGG